MRRALIALAAGLGLVLATAPAADASILGDFWKSVDQIKKVTASAPPPAPSAPPPAPSAPPVTGGIAGNIDVPRPLDFSQGTAIFLSGNGGTGTSCAFMPVPSPSKPFASADNGEGGKAFGFRNDCARSLRLVNVKAPLTIKISDPDFGCFDNVIRDSKPRAKIFIRHSGSYTIGSSRARRTRARSCGSSSRTGGYLAPPPSA